MTNVDDFDKEIIRGLASGLTLKDIAKQSYALKDEGTKFDLCLNLVKGKVQLMMFNFDCKTKTQLVVCLVVKLKLVNLDGSNVAPELELTKRSV